MYLVILLISGCGAYYTICRGSGPHPPVGAATDYLLPSRTVEGRSKISVRCLPCPLLPNPLLASPVCFREVIGVMAATCFAKALAIRFQI